MWGWERPRGLVAIVYISEQSLLSILSVLLLIWLSISETFLGGKLASCSTVFSTCKHFCLTCLLSTKPLLIPLKNCFYCDKIYIKNLPFLMHSFVATIILTLLYIHHHYFQSLFIIPIIYHSSICFSASQVVF